MGYDPNRPADPEPIKFRRSATVRVGFWIMWPWPCSPSVKLLDRLTIRL